ncbi:MULTISPECIES: hypothetical protein [Bacillus cereus group]|uniref:Uncharacterized protein n=2 Tax=Bacillus cereus group TaxID=86661 RepID=A0A9W7PZU3_BACCE|nr:MULTISPECIES: hypothetical protein [Bacillus cereus group]KAA6452619.1 hypothetical protein DX932_28930 [Bacillus cereus]KAB2444003.1 hypothetical protein F8163_08490 [Bacillus luti]KAB2501334.1 hypothetical protein F8156_20365 [Bacillus cereus]WOA60655.1 hypothetical protein RVY74_30460 [Bacillus mycoides]
MNTILNFEPFNPTINDIAIKLAMVLFIPLFLALLVKVILMRFMRESIASRLASLSCLFFMYYVFRLVTE